MIFDGIVLAGGRSTRLGGTPKQSLTVDGTTLLERTVAALAPARRVVVVGDGAPAGVLRTREQPAFAGPAAAIGAGLAALDDVVDERGAAALVVILACDMPDAHLLVAHLAVEPAGDGNIAFDSDGAPQYLAIALRTAALRAALERAAPLDGLPVRRLLDGLDLQRIDVPPGATRDIDTWEDARAFGLGRDSA